MSKAEGHKFNPEASLSEIINKFDLDHESYMYKAMQASAANTCLDKCIKADHFRTPNLGNKEKVCISRCHQAYYYTFMASFFAMQNAQVAEAAQHHAEKEGPVG